MVGFATPGLTPAACGGGVWGRAMETEASQLAQVAEHLLVRSFLEPDQEAVSRLYAEGLLVGQIAPNDTGADVENIQEAYLQEESSHFWVAELDGHVLGMIGVARDHDHHAEIRRLRVDPDWQHTVIGARLVETALAHCSHHGYLKVVLDTRFDTDAAMSLFDRFAFQHTRTRSLHGKDQLEFYLDLYRQPSREGQSVR